MKSTFKLIRRFVLILMLSILALIVFNIALLIGMTYDDMSNAGSWADAETVGEQLTEVAPRQFELSEAGKEILERRQAWAVLVEDGTGDVIWHSDGLPEEVPLHYSVADISWGTRGYIQDYPTTTGSCGEHLVILGHPKTMYWKQMWNTYDYQTIANAPKILLIFLLANFFLIVVIYMTATSGVLRSVKPIVKGIETLPEAETYVREKGLLSELARAINRASEKLRMQERELRRKERARADWIAGVSHDIRTPLTMVMGYAGQLEEDTCLPEEARKRAEIIRLESLRMRNLVNDLNLASKLEYGMQPVKTEPVNLTAVTRQAVADFVNALPDGKYPVRWDAGGLTSCVVQGDGALIGRALSNVLRNAQLHNPAGCTISIAMVRQETAVQIRIEDDGVGVTDEQLERLRTTPHYMVSNGSMDQRHGLGLQIVCQIAAAHNGAVSFDHGSHGGFLVQISFPI